MQGFDYATGRAVNHTIRRWKALAQEAVRRGGLVREYSKLRETWIVDKSGLVFEVYDVNLNLVKETTDERPIHARR